MSKILTTTIKIAFLIFILHSCKKQEIYQSTIDDRSILFSKVITYLEAERIKSNGSNTKKLENILKYIGESKIPIINFNEETNLFICDLSKYKNKSNPDYQNTFYKLYFQYTKDSILGGMIYTIHTNLSKTDVDADFEKIFLQKSATFSGRIVVNRLNDEFAQELVFKSGKLEKSYMLGVRNETNEKSKEYPKENKTNNFSNKTISNTNSTCYSYYWVVTQYYSDGSKTEEWEYLYTECSFQGCSWPEGQVIDWIDNGSCDGVGGGGADIYTTEYDGFEEEVLDEEMVISCGAKMHYDITRLKKNGVTYSVYAAPAICLNPSIDCTVQNKNCRRTVQVGSHTPIVTPLVNYSWRVTYIYTNFYTFKFFDGTPTSTNYRNVNISKVVS